ncbi:MAG TPA: PDZ domain-containing protein [bacterium]
MKGPAANDPLKPAPTQNGLLVKIVITNSPAYYVGIHEGDLLTSLAGEQLATADQFFDVVSRNAGQKVALVLIGVSLTILAVFNK